MRTDQPTEEPFLPDPSAIEISDEKYNELRELSIEMVQETIIGKTDSMAPVLFVHYRKFQEGGMMGDLGHAIVMIAGYGDPKGPSKRDLMFRLGLKFEQERMIPAAIFMGAEAWVSDSPKPGVAPSNDPDRKECICIHGRSIGGECKSGTIIPIGHDAKGNIIREGDEIKMPDGCDIHIPMLDAFFEGFFSTAKERYDKQRR